MTTDNPFADPNTSADFPAARFRRAGVAPEQLTSIEEWFKALGANAEAKLKEWESVSNGAIKAWADEKFPVVLEDIATRLQAELAELRVSGAIAADIREAELKLDAILQRIVQRDATKAPETPPAPPESPKGAKTPSTPTADATKDDEGTQGDSTGD